MTRILLTLSIITLALGCGDKPPGITFDAGSDASDAAVDPDADPIDGDTTEDADVDAELPDGSTDPDAAVDDDGGTSGPTCATGIACGASDTCDDGRVCVVNACGTKVCQVRAVECASSAECAAGSACTATGVGDICRPTAAVECNASTDCPPSHSCEANTCVLRRIVCANEEDCPISHRCTPVEGDAFACIYVYRPCDNAGTCPFGVCENVDGIGGSECGGGAACETNATCSNGERCVAAIGVTCGLGGLCNASGGDSCTTGFECLDLGGDGYGECVPTGGTCDTHADCGPSQRCVVQAGPLPPECRSTL